MQHGNQRALLSSMSNPYFVAACFALYLLLRLAIVLAVSIDRWRDHIISLIFGLFYQPTEVHHMR